jgi:sulfur carrier protein|uniref:Thiamine biosynthesis protein n=1 Tax=Thalassiosira profunda TaxID=376140 RepID=A0A8K1HQW5_9STRA|nr:Thiamine biosynthesis protein [Thalassiosira profunda]UBQ34756.1 Thiamine biosynthesis protein [Thalassiosira profunda]
MKERNKFFLNGEEFFSDKTLNLSDIINYFNYNSSLLVLEYNHFICPKENWETVFIQDNDKIEIVTIVGGG